MGNINNVIVEGNLTKSAELSRWGDGTAYIRFTIANNDYYKKENGEYESIPSFIDCQCKGPYAESMSKHLLKGRRITVSGKLKQQRWTDEQGVKHSAIVVRVNEISLTPFGNNSFRPSEESQQNEARRYESENYQPDNYDSSMFDDSEEIPF
jgi:single-strand DNA-binding protein